jgi:glycosyltransferase involved in cell wall biosynthesis
LSSVPIEILHLVYGHYPADTRVKRELTALRATGRRCAVIAVRQAGESAAQAVDGVVTIRVPGRRSRGGFLSYLIEYGDFVLRCRRLIAKHPALARVQVVHVHTLPDFLLWAALPARRRGARIVFDMHEIFPEFAHAKYPGILGSIVGAVATRFERWARRRADLIITVNHPIDELLAGRPASPREHRIVVHNTADPQDFGQRPRVVDGEPGPLQLVYHGTLTHLYGLDIAVRATAAAPGNPQLTIIGDGPERQRLEALTRSLKTLRVRFESPITQQALAARLPRFHGGVVPTRLNGMTRYSLSTKLLEYVHLGIPVLAARLPSYQRYFAEDALWYWNPGEPADLVRAIQHFATASPAERALRAERAREAIAPLAWTRQMVTLLNAYAELLTGDGSARIAAIRSAAVPSP